MNDRRAAAEEDPLRPPNTALQRTRSAPLRSPLSFKTLGAARLRFAVSILAFTFVVTGCLAGPSRKEYRARLATAAGEGAIDCGLVTLSSSKVAAVSCVRSALATRRPVFVVFQVMGMDSEFYRGLAVNRSGHAIELRWNGDISGGSHIVKKSQIDERPCEQASVVEDDDPIRCFKPTGA